jgi:hypothetical protein
LGLVKHLALNPLDTIEVGGLGGVVTEVDASLVAIELRGLPPLTVEAIAADEPWILLGRDADNPFRLLLDGPAGALEVA